MSTLKLSLLIALILSLCIAHAQTDTALQTVQQLPIAYLKQTEKKVKTYTDRVNAKTEKTLTKLSKWEKKIQQTLQKVNPDAANRLFAPGQMSFTKALEEYQNGRAVASNYKAGYDKYRDDLTTQLNFIESQKEQFDQKYLNALKESRDAVAVLSDEEQRNAAMQNFIKERKQQLMQEALKHLGKSKYLQKINKETYYYAETLRNYKELFNDPKKAEETALQILDKIPAFKKFMQENSMLASMFNMPGAAGNTANLAGLQTRASVNSLIQNQIAAGGPNAMQTVQQNLQQGQAELNKLKDKLLKAGGSNGDAEIPDFKPNTQKTKTFLQRVEYGANFQAERGRGLLPGAMNIGLSLGYKINDKSSAGICASYRLGIGSIDKIRFSHEGLGLRSYLDWKLKKQFFVSGGFEMNHFASFKNIAELKDANAWQSSALIGLSKKMSVKSKFMKGTKLQLLYDFLYREQVPVRQPVVFRVGYDIK
jgi:hypothetical protein